MDTLDANQTRDAVRDRYGEMGRGRIVGFAARRSCDCDG